MLLHTSGFLLAAFAAAACLSDRLSAADPKDCASVGKKVGAAVSARPERVLIIVEDTLVTDEECACEAVKAAIVASKASAKLVGQIVLTAVSASPKKAEIIAECATAASPDASAEIKEALRKAIGTESVVQPPAALPVKPTADAAAAPKPAGDPKNPIPDKNPPPPPAEPATDADFGLSPVAIGGIYLVYPSGGGSGVQVRRDSHGRMVLIGPDGKEIVLPPEKPSTGGRKPRPPGIIIIRPPSQTASEEIPTP